MIAAIEARSEEQTQRVRALLMEQGRPDLVKQLDEQLRAIRLGLSSAGSAWHSISETQRRVLALMEQSGRGLFRKSIKPARYELDGGSECVARIATVRALAARELIAWDGGAFDPEHRVVLTERGRFVAKHGPEEVWRWNGGRC